MRARYSPITPRAKSCAPEKMAMIEARNGNPAHCLPGITGEDVKKYRKPE
jgi:hypothetical protein